MRLHNGIHVLVKKRKRDQSSFTLWYVRTHEKVTICKSGRELSPEPNLPAP